LLLADSAGFDFPQQVQASIDELIKEIENGLKLIFDIST